MGAWTGWKADFLQAGGFPTTSANRSFLDDWHQHADSNCQNNPIDLTHAVSGSGDCSSLPAITAKAQHYPSHGAATNAFLWQIDGSNYAQIRAALQSGDPYTVSNTGIVTQELSFWGSQTFSHVYFQETANAPGRGGSGGVIQAPQLHSGWQRWRESINVHMHDTLKQAQSGNAGALRTLAKARKVRI